MLLDQRVEEMVEAALHDLVELVERQVDAVIGDAVLRVVVGADAFGTVTTADLQLARGSSLVDCGLARLV